MSSIIKFLGDKKVTVKPCTPFGNQEIDFLDSLSKILMSNNNARNTSGDTCADSCNPSCKAISVNHATVANANNYWNHK